MSEPYKIAQVHARQVLDSRANPTVEADVRLSGGAFGRAAVPSGASTGSHEAHELRDSDDPVWAGRGVLRAVANANNILGPAIQGLDAREQAAVDGALRAIDGSEALSRLGANAVLAISLATAQAAAAALDLPFYLHVAELAGARPLLPLPMVNIISGGAHAGRNLDIQDVLVMPIGADSYRSGLAMIVRVYCAMRELLVTAGYPPLVGDEGGFGPHLSANENALALIVTAIERAGLRPGEDMALALDVAATGFYHDGFYHMTRTTSGLSSLQTPQMVALVERWTTLYPLISIEDPLAEDDWEGWQQITERLGNRHQLIGDDLFVTNTQRLTQGIERGIANTVLVKVNQIGTLTGALQTLALATAHGYRAVISARSGETEDTWLADLAVGSGAGQIKVGSVARSERLAKYNRLLRIEEECGATVPYAGGAIWTPQKRV